MAVNLSRVKQGDVFKTRSGEYMGYWFSESTFFGGQYKHKLYNLKNEQESYWYNDEGVCGHEAKSKEMSLVEKIDALPEDVLSMIEESKKNASIQSTEDTHSVPSREDTDPIENDSNDVPGGWETILKIVGWIVFIGGFIACLVLAGNGAEEICWIPLLVGILIPAPIMVFANMATSLKENNALNRQILEELKKLNKNNS